MKAKRILAKSIPLFVLALLLAPQAAGAVNIEEHMWPLTEETGAALPQTPLMTVISNVIKWVLGFLGLGAAVLIIVGGFKWMTSGGNEEQIASAKKLMTNGIIGLVIIILAYTIAHFVINALTEVTTETTTP